MTQTLSSNIKELAVKLNHTIVIMGGNYFGDASWNFTSGPHHAEGLVNPKVCGLKQGVYIGWTIKLYRWGPI
jgi:hypothetical protein